MHFEALAKKSLVKIGILSDVEIQVKASKAIKYVLPNESDRNVQWVVRQNLSPRRNQLGHFRALCDVLISYHDAVSSFNGFQADSNHARLKFEVGVYEIEIFSLCEPSSPILLS